MPAAHAPPEPPVVTVRQQARRSGSGLTLRRSSKSERPADVYILLDGSGSMLCDHSSCKYSMENWDLEKQAAIAIVQSMAKNLTNLTVGMAQFSATSDWYDHDDGATEQAPVTSNIAQVVNNINAQKLRYGGTDFGSPLAMCFNSLEKSGFKDPTGKVKPLRFCLLVTDGIPDESTPASPSMIQTCTALNISTGTKPSAWLDKRNVPPCNMRNIMYAIKAKGYVVFGVFVGTKGASADMIKRGSEMINLYSSCEIPICPRTCGFCPASEVGCEDNEAMLRLKSTVQGKNLVKGVPQPYAVCRSHIMPDRIRPHPRRDLQVLRVVRRREELPAQPLRLRRRRGLV